MTLAAILLGHNECAAAADTVRLSLGSTTDPAYLPFFVALDKGYYRQFGLDVQVVYVGGGVATPALISGWLTFSTSTGSAMTAILGGAALKIVMNLSERVPWKLWATGADIKTLQDLKGKGVGIQTHGDLFEMSMRMVLRKAGMASDSVRYVQLGFGSAARIAAIRQRLLPAVMLTNLEARIVRRRGILGHAHVLVDVSRAIRVPNNGIAVSDKMIAVHPLRIERMLRAALMAVRYIETRPAGALRILERHAPKLPPDVLRAAMNETATTYLNDGTASPAALKSAITVRGSIIGLPPDQVPPPSKVFDYSLVRRVAQRLAASKWVPAP